jgi:hypothetical protein
MWDFRAYHVRAINAATEAEKASINQELKDHYESLNESDKKLFNEALQSYLLNQYKTLADDYQHIKNAENGIN